VATVIVIEKAFFTRMAIIFIEKLAFAARITTPIIFKFLLMAFMADTFVEIGRILRTMVTFPVIIVVFAVWTLMADSPIEKRCLLRTFSNGDRNNTFITIRLICRTFIADPIIEILLMLRAAMASTIFVFVLQIFGATACANKRIPYFRAWTVGTVFVLVEYVRERTLAFLSFLTPNEV